MQKKQASEILVQFGDCSNLEGKAVGQNTRANFRFFFFNCDQVLEIVQDFFYVGGKSAITDLDLCDLTIQ